MGERITPMRRIRTGSAEEEKRRKNGYNHHRAESIENSGRRRISEI
jgi:hypothetical protein